MNKYNVGDYVILKKIFSPTITAEGTNYDTSRGSVVVKVTEVSSSSTGFCYRLESPQGIDLGGILYWEDDIDGVAITKSLEDKFQDEKKLWRAWGDR